MLGFTPHERVPRDLGDTRRRRHRKRRRVAPDDGRDARTQGEVVVVAVEDDSIGLVPEGGKLPERTAPGGPQCRRHAEGVALLVRRVADADRDRPPTHARCHDLAFVACQLLRVAHTAEMVGRGDERCHGDRAGPRAPAHFVDADDDRLAGAPAAPFQTQGRSPRA